MPMYTYNCPKCGWVGDRQCKLLERDDQCCNAESAPDQAACATPLVREEIPLDQAKMNHNWGNWR